MLQIHKTNSGQDSKVNQNQVTPTVVGNTHRRRKVKKKNSLF